MLQNLTEYQRAYFYRVAVAVVALCVVLRVFVPDVRDAVVEIIAAVFGISAPTLATKFTSTAKPERPEALDGDLDRGSVTLIEVAAALVALVCIVWLVVFFKNGG